MCLDIKEISNNLLVFPSFTAETILGAEITQSNKDLIAGTSSVTLTCKAAQGNDITREWTKNGTSLSPSNRVIISEDNVTVSISPVEQNDTGEYKCKLSNLISTEEATLMLTVHRKCTFRTSQSLLVYTVR